MTEAGRTRPRRRLLQAGIGTLGLVTGSGARHARAAEPATNTADAPGPPSPTAAFSRMPPGERMPEGWREQRLGRIPPNRMQLVAQAGQSVLQIDSSASASSLIHPFSPPRVARGLAWRWRTERWPAVSAGLGQKAGDDFSLRLYLLFEYPLSKLPLAQRLALELARVATDSALPAATLCYVADPRAPVGTWQDSPYSARVRIAVIRGTESPGAWWSESRDLMEDFQRAFGTEYGPGMPPISAVALAADTDQGGGRTRSWFSDLVWR